MIIADMRIVQAIIKALLAYIEATKPEPR